MKLVLDCPCGVRLTAADERSIIERARQHLSDSHPGMSYSDDEILFLTRQG